MALYNVVIKQMWCSPHCPPLQCGKKHKCGAALIALLYNVVENKCGAALVALYNVVKTQMWCSPHCPPLQCGKNQMWCSPHCLPLQCG